MPFHQANLDIQIQCLIRQYRQANLHKQIQCLLRQHRSFLQASRSFTAPVSPRRYCRLVRIMRHFSPAEVSSSCLLIQLSRCSYSFANHPGGLLPVWEFTLRDCCAIMATIGICIFCCRPFNVSNLCFQFVWRMDKIYFWNSYCRIGGVKNE